MLALLATEDDENERLRLVIGIIAIFRQSQQMKRIIKQRIRALALKYAAELSLRNDPSGAHTSQQSVIYAMIYNQPHHFEFKHMFWMSRPAFEATEQKFPAGERKGRYGGKQSNC